MKNYLYAMGAILCWASLPAATGSGLDGLSIPQLMLFSFTSAAAVLYAQNTLKTSSFKLPLPEPKLSLLGVWGIFIYHGTYYLALDHTPLAEGAILTTTWSFWIVVFSSILTHRRLKITTTLTAIAGLAGAAMVVSAGKTISFDLAFMKGYLLCLACGLIWSSFSVALGRTATKKPGDPMPVFTLYAALLSAALYIATGPHPWPESKALASAIYLGCVPLGLSFFFWNRAVSGGNLVVVGYLSYLTPPLAVLMVGVIHRQAVPFQVVLGMGVILGASLLGSLAEKKDHRESR